MLWLSGGLRPNILWYLMVYGTEMETPFYQVLIQRTGGARREVASPPVTVRVSLACAPRTAFLMRSRCDLSAVQSTVGGSSRAWRTTSVRSSTDGRARRTSSGSDAVVV